MGIPKGSRAPVAYERGRPKPNETEYVPGEPLTWEEYWNVQDDPRFMQVSLPREEGTDGTRVR